MKASFLSGILPLKPSQIPAEILGGITLASLAVPTVMGYTRIAGTPVITGLYTMLVPALLFALFASSRHLVVSADSATAAILATGLAGMAATGGTDYLALAGLLALMVGAGLIVAAVVGLGFMADFLSRTVLVGFLTGVGIQIALRAVSELVGLPVPDLDSIATIWAHRHRFEGPAPAALAVAVAVLAIIVSGRLLEKRTGRAIPAPLLAVIGAIAASWAFDLKTLLPVVGDVPAGLPDLAAPQVEWSFRLVRDLLPTALVMIIVILAQSAATARGYAQRNRERLDQSGDLMALGFANIGAGLSGTFVVNGSPTQTAMVYGAGGRSQLALVVASLVVLAILMFLTRPLALLPDAVLSAVVFLIGLKLVDIGGMKKIRRERPAEFRIALLTTAVVVLVGVEEGIILSVVLSLILHTRHGYRPQNYLLIRNNKDHWHARPLSTDEQEAPGLAIYRFSHSMYYANCDRMKSEIETIVNRASPQLHWLCIDVSSVDDIDFTSSEALADLVADIEKKGVKVVFVQDVHHVNARTRDQIRKRMPEQKFFKSLEKVVKAYAEGQLATPQQNPG